TALIGASPPWPGSRGGIALQLDYGPLWRQSAFDFESRRHGTRTGLRPSLAPVRLCLRIAANPNLDSPPACCREILLERLPSNSARPFSPAAGFLFVKAGSNSHQSVAVPVKSPVSDKVGLCGLVKQPRCVFSTQIASRPTPRRSLPPQDLVGAYHCRRKHGDC